MSDERKPDNPLHDAAKFTWDDHFFGSVTVGERGQVVIPAEARKRYRIEPGDKLLMFDDPAKHGLMLCKLESMRSFMEIFSAGLARISQMEQEEPSAPKSPEDTKS